MMFMSFRTTYLADGQPATAASMTDASGVEHPLSYASAMRMLEESQPPIETPIEELEQDVLGLLFILFQHKRQHPIILDGKENGVVRDRRQANGGILPLHQRAHA